MRKCALASTRLHTHINTHTFLVMIHFFWNYRPTLRNVLPFGTAALHKNDEQKKWLLKECDGDDDVLFVYMKIPANAGQSGTTSALSVVLKSDRLSRKIVLIILFLLSLLTLSRSRSFFTD